VNAAGTPSESAQMRKDGQSYVEIGDELGRSKSDIARVCATLNCSPAASVPAMLV